MKTRFVFPSEENSLGFEPSPFKADEEVSRKRAGMVPQRGERAEDLSGFSRWEKSAG
jgi:hypothetical protein